MSVVLCVGTAKGAAFLRSDPARERWEVSPLEFKGWIVTAATRDARGRTYLAVGSAVYGAAVLVSDDLESWEQLESAPRYEAGERGNAGHNLIVGSAAPGQLDRYVEGGRHVDQIWTLRAAGDVVYAGVSEAGLFRTDDRGKSWQPVRGLNDHETRPDWLAGAGGLCAHTVLVDPRAEEQIWVGISAAGVFRSDDGGRSFVSANEGVSRDEGYCIHSLALRVRTARRDGCRRPRPMRRLHRYDLWRSLREPRSWRVLERAALQAAACAERPGLRGVSAWVS